MSRLVETKNPMVYLGSKRRKKIEQLAISLSHLSGKQISVSNIAQDIIDTYFDDYREKAIAEISEDSQTQICK